jgi:hypothetical protein
VLSTARFRNQFLLSLEPRFVAGIHARDEEILRRVQPAYITSRSLWDARAWGCAGGQKSMMPTGEYSGGEYLNTVFEPVKAYFM